MRELLGLVSSLQSSIAGIAGFDEHSGSATTNFLLIVALAIFGAQYLNRLTDRHTSFHLAVSLSTMFLGAVVGNALLRSIHMPLGHELLVTATFALLGMAATGLLLILAYRNVEF